MNDTSFVCVRRRRRAAAANVTEEPGYYYYSKNHKQSGKWNNSLSSKYLSLKINNIIILSMLTN